MGEATANAARRRGICQRTIGKFGQAPQGMSRVIVQQAVAPFAARLGESASGATLRERPRSFSQFKAEPETGTEGTSVEENGPEAAEQGLPD
jgi:hypothetical protein